MTETDPRWRAQAWSFSAIMGFATYCVALAIILPLETAHNDAFMAGSLFVPAAVGVVAGGVLATNIEAEPWRLAAPWVAPPLVAAMVLLVTQGDDFVRQLQERTAAGRSEASANEGGSKDVAETYGRSHIEPPESAIGWHKVNVPAVNRQAERVRKQLKAEDPGAALVYGAYRRGEKSMALFAINTGANSELRDEFERSPRRALTNYMAGSGVADPILMKTDIEGIELMCSGIQRGAVVCSWADLTSVGNAAWYFAGVDRDQAAKLTEGFIKEARILDW